MSSPPGAVDEDLEPGRSAAHPEVDQPRRGRHVDEQQQVHVVRVDRLDVAADPRVGRRQADVRVHERLEQPVARVGRVERRRHVELLRGRDQDRPLRLRPDARQRQRRLQLERPRVRQVHVLADRHVARPQRRPVLRRDVGDDPRRAGHLDVVDRDVGPEVHRRRVGPLRRVSADRHVHRALEEHLPRHDAADARVAAVPRRPRRPLRPLRTLRPRRTVRTLRTLRPRRTLRTGLTALRRRVVRVLVALRLRIAGIVLFHAHPVVTAPHRERREHRHAGHQPR
jgi:hypothetical protein